ncbi:class I SAM-dependent methyltransferase [Paracoccus laeviglucosivorans]|uniref:Methyltransferase domain-containing protein n=1 Tax=Paracoccus laeviglucosivorans TaxID=1197861 RepID=A0A521EK13_9RHOB|nr:class I SAM-dependent methyltransferase [Paracoccus laeviglucosivorans]SMO84222.1 hypothetical protein SAMN06265221_113111 [Paracoccus laeviglucosivorans]
MPTLLDGESLVTSELFDAASGRVGRAGELPNPDISLRLDPVLDAALAGFAANLPASRIVSDLAAALHVLRRTSSPQDWKAMAIACRAHPVGDLLRQDPFTGRSAGKPRGYSGDAELLDIFYKHPSADEVVNNASTIGRAIYEHTSEVPSSEAGRERCRLLAANVDEACQRVGSNAQILAVAAGHLREAEICASLDKKRILRWVALDQDPLSIATIRTNHAGTPIEAVEGSVLGLLRRSYDLGTFDHVYASGLYDYLTAKTGAKLLGRLCEMVAPGGTLLFANYSDEIVSDGYMESFMDWPLILRSEADMRFIVEATPETEEFSAEYFYGANRNIVYAKLTRDLPISTASSEHAICYI